MTQQIKHGFNGTRTRVALIADEIGSPHGWRHTLARLRDEGVPGHEIHVIGTGESADRRLATVAEVELPYHPGGATPVPGIVEVASALSERPYELVHVCAPGPAGTAALLAAHGAGLPVVGVFPAALAHDAEPSARALQSWHALELLVSFYRHCNVVLSPSRRGDATLGRLGVGGDRLRRWQRATDLKRFSPARYCPAALPTAPDAAPDRINLLYSGSLAADHGLELLIEAFLRARSREPRLHLVLLGDGDAWMTVGRRLGHAGTLLGRLDGDQLAHVYATADLLVFPAGPLADDQVILDAQASGLPVLAVEREGCADLIENGRSGCLVTASPAALSDAISGLARRATLLERLSTGGLLAARERSWENCARQLAEAWEVARSGELGIVRDGAIAA